MAAKLLMGEVSLSAIVVYPSSASSLYLVQNPRLRNALKFDDLRIDSEMLYIHPCKSASLSKG
ncbi:MAG: hypothetical protein V7L04_06620 [Nostoc sp.]